MYRVKYEDNSGNEDGIDEYKTKEEAEKAIKEELELLKEIIPNYDYGDFGRKTEIWSSGGDVYASWERLWK